MKYTYQRDNFGKPVIDKNCTSDLLTEMFWACSLSDRVKLALFLRDSEKKNVKFRFNDDDRVTVSRKVNKNE